MANMYGGNWLVVRKTDGRIMTVSPWIEECFAWIENLGDLSYSRKKGRELAPRFVRRIREQFPEFLA